MRGVMKSENAIGAARNLSRKNATTNSALKTVLKVTIPNNPAMQTIRPVKIERIGDSWLVFYTDRKKGQRYTAAQFYALVHTLSDVENYIKTQPNLRLEPQH